MTTHEMFEWKHKNVIVTSFVVAAVRQRKALHQLWKHDDERYTHQPLGGRTGVQKQSQNEQVHLSNDIKVHIFSKFIVDIADEIMIEVL